MRAADASALQESLAAEHAAVYVFAGIGGATSQAAAATLYADLTSAYQAHRLRRDRWDAALRDLDQQPVAAEATYRLPADLASPRQAREAALEVERRCAAVYASLVAASTGDERVEAMTALVESALTQLRFGGEPESFPGVPELSGR